MKVKVDKTSEMSDKGQVWHGSCFLSYTAENSHHLTAKTISKEELS
jgi:hypothetical protein